MDEGSFWPEAGCEEEEKEGEEEHREKIVFGYLVNQLMIRGPWFDKNEWTRSNTDCGGWGIEKKNKGME